MSSIRNARSTVVEKLEALLPPSFQPHIGKLIAIFALFCLVAIMTIIGTLNRTYRNWQADTVSKVCQSYYEREVSPTVPFKAVGSYDSDEDGYGSCGVYIGGKRVDVLECDASLLFNTGRCRPAKRVYQN